MAVSAPRARPLFGGRVPSRLLLLGLALAVALGGAYAAIAGNPFARSNATPTYQTAAATLGALQVTVSATGPITTAASVPLSFKSSGKLSEVDVAIGQTVTAGQTLAKEDTTDLQTAVDQAQATLTQQQANLAELQAGATPEAVAAAQAQVDAAQTTLDNAQRFFNRLDCFNSTWVFCDGVKRPSAGRSHGRQDGLAPGSRMARNGSGSAAG